MILLLAGFVMYTSTAVPGGTYSDTYAIEVLPGDEATLRGVEVAVDDNTILETVGPSSIEGAGVEVQELPGKSPRIVDKIAF